MWKHAKDLALQERAREVIPNGMYGHESIALMPDDYPQFFTHADGTRIWDADGNSYLDFMCAYGPNLLGYGRPEVEEAIREQTKYGNTLTGPGPIMVELAETMVDMVGHADWAMFCKNGSDATSIALVTVRAYRSRRKILVARNAYHGSQPWCTPNHKGTVAEDRAHLIYFDWNDLESLKAAVVEAGNDLAGVFATPFQHDVFADQTIPNAEYARAVRRICDEHDALLVVDEIRASFRLSRDCSWSKLGVAPDLSCWGKVLGNGQPISAVLGAEKVKAAAESIFVTGSFWFSAVPMAAALATLKIVRETDYLERMESIGSRFREKLCRQAEDFGFSLRHTGPVTMPMVLFEDDPDFRLGYHWCTIAMKNGVYLSPYHNMFINAAMTETDIDNALQATGTAFDDLRKNRENLLPPIKLQARLQAARG